MSEKVSPFDPTIQPDSLTATEINEDHQISDAPVTESAQSESTAASALAMMFIQENLENGKPVRFISNGETIVTLTSANLKTHA